MSLTSEKRVEALRGRSSSRRPQRSVVREYAEVLFFALAIFLFVRTFVVQAFRIPSGSMENTLLVGDFLFVNKFLYGAHVPFTPVDLPKVRDPRRGDIMVFRYPEDLTKDYIKRVIGTPGDRIEIRNKVVYVNGRPLDEPYAHFSDPRLMPAGYKDPQIRPAGAGNRDNFGPITVPPGRFFMMGDNRDNSLDSRYWGFLDRQLIKGKALVIYWSWDPDHRLLGFLPAPRLMRIGRIIR